MIRRCYLAGPISGLTLEQASEWREFARSRFPEWLKGVSPLRGKSYLKEIVGSGTLKDHYTNKILSTPRGITVRDRYDATHCDAMLVNFLGSSRISIGTVMEIAWADANRIPVVVCMEKDNPHYHSMICECVLTTDNLNEGIDLIVNLMTAG